MNSCSFYKIQILQLLLLGQIVLINQHQIQAQDIYLTKDCRVEFVSDAPLELIRASSDKLNGAIDLEKRTFAFSIPNNSFKGFNSPLQQEHFYENYIESHEYPTSTYEGKIIEDYDFQKDGEYEVRAKGKFNIHGVSKERIIKAKLLKKGNEIKLKANFSIPLEEHNIHIPRIVYQKIAEVIDVSIEGKLKKTEQ
ncbi:MAG: YceI family protein [Bacteroidales bacterium]|nr:YceI family protein [Bacteroidales bacterium]MCF8387043.1 YceI family protein [Bacteroidales bacterium]MCF8397674.1 YceI family protein [Bacteroidales bacterium]